MTTYIDIIGGDRVFSTPCQVIGIYAVHNTLTDAGFTAVAWTVTAIEFGRELASFYNEKVACNFARWLMGEFGDLNPLFIRIANQSLSADDQETIDYIRLKSRHECNVACRRDNHEVVYVPLYTQDGDS